MPATTEDPRARITIDPDTGNGCPTIRKQRITAATMLNFLSAGDPPGDIPAA